MLELIAKFAEANGLSRDEISHVPLNVLLNVAKKKWEKKNCYYILFNFTTFKPEKRNKKFY